MKSKLPSDHAMLYQRVDELLHYIWDPMGVAGRPEARDEYQNYLPRVFRMIVENIPARDVKNYFIQVETREMELPLPFGRSEQLDDLLNSLYLARELILETASQATRFDPASAATEDTLYVDWHS